MCVISSAHCLSCLMSRFSWLGDWVEWLTARLVTLAIHQSFSGLDNGSYGQLWLSVTPWIDLLLDRGCLVFRHPYFMFWDASCFRYRQNTPLGTNQTRVPLKRRPHNDTLPTTLGVMKSKVICRVTGK